MITIKQAQPEEFETVLILVFTLLRELASESNDFDKIDKAKVVQDIIKNRDHFTAFIAKDGGTIIGVLTLVESFAIFAGGNYGVIDEMYIAPEFRSKGIGALFIDAVKDLAREKGWIRIDAVAPPGEKWERTRKFYKKNGFEFMGPRLRLIL